MGLGDFLKPHGAQQPSNTNSEPIAPAVAPAKGPANHRDAPIPDFDLPKAVAMGLCAFQAYNAPGDVVGVVESSSTGTQTVYKDQDFLLSRATGVAQVRAHAAHVKAKYITVGTDASGGIARGDSSEAFFLYVKDDKELVVKAFDSGADSVRIDNVPIATATTPLAPLTDGQRHSVQVELGSLGTVTLDVQYAPVDAATLATLQDKFVMDEPDAKKGGLGGLVGGMAGAVGGALKGAKERFTGQKAAAEAANTQPKDRPSFLDWVKLHDGIVSRELTTRTEPIAFVFNKETDTELWVYRNEKERDLIFSFRGTSSPKDAITDLGVPLVPFVPGKRVAEPSMDEVEREIQKTDGEMANQIKQAQGVQAVANKLTFGAFGKFGPGQWFQSLQKMLYAAVKHQVWVHAGFLKAYLSVAARVRAIADEVTAGNDKWNIYITGHSLGAALATLCSYDMSFHTFEKSPQPNLHFYGFGTPRVGNVPFQETFDEKLDDAWRICNINDIVTKVPTLLGFSHVGVEVRLMEGADAGKLAMTRGTFDVAREDWGEVVKKASTGALSRDPKAQKSFQDMIANEMATMTSLVQGKAVADHMEDIYHLHVKQCVDAGGDSCKAIMYQPA